MDVRIKFKQGEQRKFLLEVQSKSGLSNEKLATIAKVVPRSYRDWKREKYSIPLSIAKLFCVKYGLVLPEDKDLLVNRWNSAKKDASRKGGLGRQKKYGDLGTKKGRSKGGKRSLEVMRKYGIIPEAKKFSLPMVFSSELAEFVGILLGDGGITTSQVQIFLNKSADKEYISYVRSLGRKLFGEEPKVLVRDAYNVCVIYYNGTNLVKYLVSIGLKVGNKVKMQVDVPGWIKEDLQFKISCLRGLMDTDGGIFLHKYSVANKSYSYRKLCFANRSLPLVSYVASTLSELGMNPKITHMETKRVWLYNSREVKNYLNFVGTNNSRLTKYFRD